MSNQVAEGVDDVVCAPTFVVACRSAPRELTPCVISDVGVRRPELDATMMRDSRKLVCMRTALSLLWANAGCLSMEPISSYSSGQRDVAEVSTALEPAPADPSSDPQGMEGAAPADDVLEGLPGDGEVPLDPGVDTIDGPEQGAELGAGSAEEEPSVVDCVATGEFASSDGTSCYLSSAENASWTDALERCESWGGSLVNIDSPAEDAFLATRVTSTFWIAAS